MLETTIGPQPAAKRPDARAVSTGGNEGGRPASGDGAKGAGGEGESDAFAALVNEKAAETAPAAIAPSGAEAPRPKTIRPEGAPFAKPSPEAGPTAAAPKSAEGDRTGAADQAADARTTASVDGALAEAIAEKAPHSSAPAGQAAAPEAASFGSNPALGEKASAAANDRETGRAVSQAPGSPRQVDGEAGARFPSAAATAASASASRGEENAAAAVRDTARMTGPGESAGGSQGAQTSNPQSIEAGAAARSQPAEVVVRRPAERPSPAAVTTNERSAAFAVRAETAPEPGGDAKPAADLRRDAPPEPDARPEGTLAKPRTATHVYSAATSGAVAAGDSAAATSLVEGAEASATRATEATAALARSEAVAGPQARAAAAAGTTAEAQSAATQIASAISRGGAGDRIELRLDPPELGRVSVSLAVKDDAVVASISAERPETDALLRRHGDELQKALREQGFGDVNLEFGDGREDRGRSADAGDGPIELVAEPGADRANGPVRSNLALDLRV